MAHSNRREREREREREMDVVSDRQRVWCCSWYLDEAIAPLATLVHVLAAAI
jgi:hypothetical protein